MLAPLRVAAAWLPFVVGCVAIWMVSGLERPPVPDALQFKLSDKLMHGVAYALLAVLATVGARKLEPRRMMVVAAVLATGYGIVDEVHQSFVPHRSPSVGDVLADGLGALLGAQAVALVRLRSRRRDPAPR